MEKIQATVVTEDVAPQTDSVDNTTEAEVNANDQPTTVDPTSEAEADNQASDDNNDSEQNGTDGTDSAPFLSVRYNHEDRELTQAEAQSYAQRGIQAEPIMAELRYLAAQDGHKSVKDFLSALRNSAEKSRLENIRSQLVDDGNEDLANAILASEIARIKDAAGVIEAEEQKAFTAEYETEHSRLADEFIALQREFPEIKEFSAVSNNVLSLARKAKISLLDAQLRFNHAEQRKIKQAETSAVAAAESSAGSMTSNDDVKTSHSVIEAMKKGVWQ